MPSLIVANDLVGLGKVALSTSLPLMSVCQIEVIPLPTVILSSHTGGFKDIQIKDLSSETGGFLKQWKGYDLGLSGMVIGYVKSVDQLVALKAYAQEMQLPLFVDPIMGDQGHLYSGFDTQYVDQMKGLCREARVIVPNLTEAAYLTNSPYLTEGSYSKSDIEALLIRLSELGPQEVIVTGVSFEKDQIGLAYFNRISQKVTYIMGPKRPGHFFGTGDMLTAILSAGYFHGLSLEEVARVALDFLDQVLLTTLDQQRDLKFGLAFESHLGQLFMDFETLLEEKYAT